MKQETNKKNTSHKKIRLTILVLLLFAVLGFVGAQLYHLNNGRAYENDRIKEILNVEE